MLKWGENLNIVIFQWLNYYFKKEADAVMGCNAHTIGLFVSQFQFSQLDPVDVEFQNHAS